MQLYLRQFWNILKKQNNFEWTTEHQKAFEEKKTLLTAQISNTIPDSKIWHRRSMITTTQ